MDIKLKYKAWVGEEHPDIAHKLTDSDIEYYAIDFAQDLIKKLFPIPNFVCDDPQSFLPCNVRDNGKCTLPTHCDYQRK